jgi:hypothetical protein
VISAPSSVLQSNETDTDLIPASALVDDPSDSALEQTAIQPRRVQTFDIMGYKLGMSPREVIRISRKVKSYRRWNSIFLTTGTFELEASRRANYQLNRPVAKSSKVQISKTQGFLPDGSSMLLTFTLEPSGPKLSEIAYTTKLNGMSEEQFISAATAKYGPYDGKVLLYAWRNGVRDMLRQGKEPYLFVSVDGGTVNMTLHQSSDYLNAAEAKLKARAQEIAAKEGSGVRF